MTFKTIDEEALLEQVEKELKNVEELDEDELEAEAKKHLGKPKTSHKLKRPIDPLTRERQKERERFKRKVLVNARARFEELGLEVDAEGNVVKKEGKA